MRKLIPILILGLAFVQCQHDTVIPEGFEIPEQSAICDSDTVYFVNDIQALLMSTCATSGCHDDQTAAHGIRLTSYANIIQTGEVRPYKPNDSEIYEVLFDDVDDLMPPSPQNPLTNVQKDMIRNWILQGARNNECIEECDLTNVSFSADISVIISNSCLSCHSGSSPNGGVSLTNYSEISSLASSGKLLDVITGTNGASLMPPGAAMDDCRINKITKWIEDGSQNN
ncbi:MAG: hypothetical protein GQ527_12295 [Bacteroidales bacterium]|nr:hypothetical protein [Bacteroidales bacterium]